VEKVPTDIVEVALRARLVDLERDVAAAVIASDAGVPFRECCAAIGEDREADRRARRAWCSVYLVWPRSVRLR